MTTFRPDMGRAYLPSDFGDLLIAGVVEESRALSTPVSKIVRTEAATMLFPRVSKDAPAGFVAEGADIPIGDPDLDDVEVTPAKIAGLTITSYEAVADSDPQVAEVIGSSLIRSISARLDEAFVGNLAAPAPKGLAALAGKTNVTGATPDPLNNLDVFTEAVSAIELEGGTATAVLVSPNVARHLSTLKQSAGSNVALLGSDPTAPTKRVIGGLPVVVFRTLPDTEAYVLDGSRVVSVLRQSATVDLSKDRYFESARVAVRAIARAGYGFLHPATVARIGVAL